MNEQAMKERKLTRRSYRCPNCDESDIRFPADFYTQNLEFCRCRKCHADFRVEYDSALVDGVMEDRTQLLPMEEQ